MRGKDFKDKGSMSPRFCRWAGWILFSAGSILMIIDWRTDFALMWPGMFGSRIIIPGFALLVMDMLITIHQGKENSWPGECMSLLLLQITIVLATSLVCGRLARKLGQSRVVGEIVGGIFLAPSVLGRISPTLSGRIFPGGSLGSLDVLSTVGLILFLFMVGSELDLEHLRQPKSTPAMSSFAGILLPFSMAFIAAPLLHARFAPSGVGRLPFALFLGVSLSITAFPALARILGERKLQTGALGATALMCAAVDDVMAWMLLAIAMTFASVSGSGAVLSTRFIWLAAYVSVMVFLVRPLGRWLAARRGNHPLSYELLGVILAVALASASVTDAIGVHPLFGAFLAGICFPRVPAWQQLLRDRLEVILSLVLLPPVLCHHGSGNAIFSVVQRRGCGLG